MSSESDQRLLEIVDALQHQTEVGHIKWQTTDDDEAFLYSAGSTSILVDTSALAAPQKYWLKVINERGAEVERLVGSPDDPWDDKGNKLMALYTVARRSALSVDEVLDDVAQPL